MHTHTHTHTLSLSRSFFSFSRCRWGVDSLPLLLLLLRIIGCTGGQIQKRAEAKLYLNALIIQGKRVADSATKVCLSSLVSGFVACNASAVSCHVFVCLCLCVLVCLCLCLCVCVCVCLQKQIASCF